MRENDKSRAGAFLLGAFIGGIIGGATALLFAPSSGKRLRRKISDKAEDFYEDAQEYYETGKEKAEEIYRDGKKKVNDIVDDAKKIVRSK
jgi:gas vesicle protein